MTDSAGRQSFPDRALALQAQDFVARRGRRGVARAASLQLAPGDRGVLIGPNGAGKSTLLRALCGLAPREGGLVHGTLSWLADRPALHDSFSVAEQMAWTARLRGEPPQRCAELMTAFELAPLADRACAALSRGQRQRVALAQAMLPRVSLRVLDEPRSGLDPVGHACLDAWLEQDPAATLIATHHREDLDNAHRIWCLRDQELLALPLPADARYLECTPSPNWDTLPGLSEVTPLGEGWLVSMHDPARTIAALSEAGIELQTLCDARHQLMQEGLR